MNERHISSPGDFDPKAGPIKEILDIIDRIVDSEAETVKVQWSRISRDSEYESEMDPEKLELLQLGHGMVDVMTKIYRGTPEGVAELQAYESAEVVLSNISDESGSPAVCLLVKLRLADGKTCRMAEITKQEEHLVNGTMVYLDANGAVMASRMFKVRDDVVRNTVFQNTSMEMYIGALKVIEGIATEEEIPDIMFNLRRDWEQNLDKQEITDLIDSVLDVYYNVKKIAVQRAQASVLTFAEVIALRDELKK